MRQGRCDEHRSCDFSKFAQYFVVASCLSSCAPSPAPSMLDSGLRPDTGPPATSTSDLDWLHEVARSAIPVCDDARDDKVWQAFCSGAPPPSSLKALQEALGIDARLDNRTHGLTSSSPSLVVNLVSELNPRLVVSSFSPNTERTNVALAFTRGERLIELMALDDSAKRLNLYLLVFDPGCGEKCAISDHFSEAFANQWSGFKLFKAEALTDTPLDCSSCHFLDTTSGFSPIFRQPAPWANWIPNEPGLLRPLDTEDLQFTQFQSVAGPTFGGISIEELENGSAHDVEGFVADMAEKIGLEFDQSNQLPPEFTSVAITGEPSETWTIYRDHILDTGTPLPAPLRSMLRPGAIDAMKGMRMGLFDAENLSPVDFMLDHILSIEAQKATGYLVEEDLPAVQVLRRACIRCHNDDTPAGTARSKFNASSPQANTKEGLKLAIDRVGLPKHSRYKMPPVRAFALTDKARGKIVHALGQWLEELHHP